MIFFVVIVIKVTVFWHMFFYDCLELLKSPCWFLLKLILVMFNLVSIGKVYAFKSVLHVVVNNAEEVVDLTELIIIVLKFFGIDLFR